MKTMLRKAALSLVLLMMSACGTDGGQSSVESPDQFCNDGRGGIAYYDYHDGEEVVFCNNGEHTHDVWSK